MIYFADHIFESSNVNIESLLPSARPEFTEFAFEVVKPGSLWRLREMDRSKSLPLSRKTRTDIKKIDRKEGDPSKIDPVEWWWI